MYQVRDRKMSVPNCYTACDGPFCRLLTPVLEHLALFLLTMIKMKHSCYEHKADLYYMCLKVPAQRSTEQILKTIESAMKKSDFTWYSFINILKSV